MMSAAISTLPGSMLSEAASISAHYPQFRPFNVPPGSLALAAWEGIIRPFTSDAIAKSFLHRVDADMPVSISEGTVVGDQSTVAGAPHWADPFLVNMADRCRLLVLSFAFPIHPRVYLLSPEFSSACLSFHPHPRSDLEIVVGGRRLAGLCIYSAAEFTFSGKVDRLVEYLDQASIWVARHLIWLRTRRLFRITTSGPKLMYSPSPGELILDTEVGIRNAAITSIIPRERRFWNGYWPGRGARIAGKDHLRLLRSNGECWCGSGQTYAACHRPIEASMR
jgi:SEC-C motif